MRHVHTSCMFRTQNSLRNMLRNESCEILRATVPANEPAAAAINGFVWNSENPCVPISTARIEPDSAIDENPRNQLVNLFSTAAFF